MRQEPRGQHHWPLSANLIWISVQSMATTDYASHGGDEIMTTLAEEWKQEGREEGVQQGKIESTQDLLIEILEDELDVPSQNLIDNIRSIKSYEILRGLFKKARKANSLEEFQKELNKLM